MWRRFRQRAARVCGWSAGLLAAVCAASLLVHVAAHWVREDLVLSDAALRLVYSGFGATWADFAHVPQVEWEYRPIWRNWWGWEWFYPLPCKGYAFFSSERCVYVPLYPLVPLLALAAWVLRPRKLGWPHCRACGYDLTGNVSGRCPECGTSADAPRAASQKPRSQTVHKRSADAADLGWRIWSANCTGSLTPLCCSPGRRSSVRPCA